MKLPVYTPQITQADIEFVRHALELGEISGNFGTYLEKFENTWAEFCGVKYGIAVTSGTTALQIALASLEFPEGSEVIISSSTNIATALAVIHNNLIPVPIDSELNTWNLDLDLIENKITSKTVAIIPVHLFGQPVDMQKLIKLAEKHSLVVIEDCAESHGATQNGKMTGSFGLAGCFSFYANKILTTGEGGMVVTNDDSLAAKLRSYRNLGFQEPRFLHSIAGFNFRMTGYQAALGLSQASRISEVLDNKIKVANGYKNLFASNNMLSVQGTIPNTLNVYWVFGILLKDSSIVTRNELMKKLSSVGIETRTFFAPMDIQPVLMKKYKMDRCPNATTLWERGLYLPSSPTLTEDEVDYIATTVNTFLNEPA